ncbi:hypothetical protein BD413DRAFT_655128 [Trametes elegans]|nr:hypothetical protein BD413DRAFT_655128 [Trametes elegans]
MRYRQREYANPYIRFDSVHRNPNPTLPLPITDFPVAAGVVDLHRCSSMLPAGSSLLALSTRILKHVRLSPSVGDLFCISPAAVVDVWTSDYGMEHCSLELTIPPASSEARDTAHSRLKGSLDPCVARSCTVPTRPLRSYMVSSSTEG